MRSGRFGAWAKSSPVVIPSPAQHAFLGLWAVGDPERIRAQWLRGGRVLRSVAEPFTYPDDLAPGDRLRAYRLASGRDTTFKGDARNRRTLDIAEFRALANCWAIPLRTLSPLGLELARAPVTAPPILAARTFKHPEDQDRALDRAAKAEGRDASAVLRELVAAWLENHR